MGRRLVVGLVLLLMVGCGADTPDPVVVSEPTTGPVPTLTALPTVTAAPSETAVPPTRTPRPSRTPTATAIPTVTPTATPDFPDYLAEPPGRGPSPGRITNGKSYPPGAYEFIHTQFQVPEPVGTVPTAFIETLPGVADGECPLTGERGPDGIEQQRPINVRIDNSPQGRPQAGLENADVIWEALAEGGVTRLTVTYHCRRPATLGPIRSARLIDLQLTPMLQAWLVHVGASQQVTDMIWAAPYADRSINEWAGDPAFYRIDQAPVGWLRTYTNGDLIRQWIATKSNVELDEPLRGWTFSAAPPAGADGAATSITIPYQPGTTAVVNYAYDPGSGRYFRYQGQGAHTVRGGAQLAPDNVVVLFAPMTSTPIVEDSLGSRSLHYNLYGSGDALLFRDGAVWELTWRREGENVLVRLVDAAGESVPLAIGQTIVQVVSPGTGVSWR